MTSTDTLAFGVLHAAYSLGRTVPDALPARTEPPGSRDPPPPALPGPPRGGL